MHALNDGGASKGLTVKIFMRTIWTLTALLAATVALLAGMLFLGIQGYRSLTREDIAARISVQPVAPQRFAATLRFADGKQVRFDLAGDEIYVDARILKWKPMANLVGLHTAYELDRISGRYRAADDERAKPRTIHELGRSKAVDLFELRKRFDFLGEVFDAEYGSGTFVPVTRPAELELRVSTTGLLIREAKTQP
jgi:hypothetical protein